MFRRCLPQTCPEKATFSFSVGSMCVRRGKGPKRAGLPDAAIAWIVQRGYLFGADEFLSSRATRLTKNQETRSQLAQSFQQPPHILLRRVARAARADHAGPAGAPSSRTAVRA